MSRWQVREPAIRWVGVNCTLAYTPRRTDASPRLALGPAARHADCSVLCVRVCVWFTSTKTKMRLTAPVVFVIALSFANSLLIYFFDIVFERQKSAIIIIIIIINLPACLQCLKWEVSRDHGTLRRFQSPPHPVGLWTCPVHWLKWELKNKIALLFLYCQKFSGDAQMCQISCQIPNLGQNQPEPYRRAEGGPSSVVGLICQPSWNSASPTLCLLKKFADVRSWPWAASCFIRSLIHSFIHVRLLARRHNGASCTMNICRRFRPLVCTIRTTNKMSYSVDCSEKSFAIVVLSNLEMLYLLFIFLYSFRCICLPLGE